MAEKKRSAALQRLIANYQVSLPEKLEDISHHHSAMLTSNTQALADFYTAVHNLAGSSGSYGFRTVSETARVLDRYLSDVKAGVAQYDHEQAASMLKDIATTIKALDYSG